MNRFTDLLANYRAEPPVEVQRRARLALPERLRQSGLQPWTTEAISRTGSVAVVGIAWYSPRDLALLDELEQLMAGQPESALSIAVFDCVDCKRPEDFQRYLPGISPVTQTPVARFWQNGQLTGRAHGLVEVREAVAKITSLRPAVSIAAG